MPRKGAVRQYGKSTTRSKADRVFSELPQTPVRRAKPEPKHNEPPAEDDVGCLTEQLSSVHIEIEAVQSRTTPRKSLRRCSPVKGSGAVETAHGAGQVGCEAERLPGPGRPRTPRRLVERARERPSDEEAARKDSSLRVLTWDEVCPPGDRVVKIAEASYAEVYRVTNDRGTSIIKVIRLDSPIKPQTKRQIQARLVDEQPHSEDDVRGELQISEWLADVPGFVVYKERYIVQGKATRGLLETHQSFQKRAKRKDPDRAQFYPSPSRYLDQTRFLVVELGDAGTSLEDWKLRRDDELWDIFLLEAIALARAEDLAMFEHRDLHEGNICIRQRRPPSQPSTRHGGFFGQSGLEITILDYGLSRAEDLSDDLAKPVAYDFERDLNFFTSTHGSQCKVYRQMRSFLLRADRTCLAPEQHTTPYAHGVDGPLSWDAYAPYTNVLWLAYLYEYLVEHFVGDKGALAQFKRETSEMWVYLNPDAANDVPCFGSAAEIVCFAVEAGWVQEEQLKGAEASFAEREDSIVLLRDLEPDLRATALRTSARRARTTMLG